MKSFDWNLVLAILTGLIIVLAVVLGSDAACAYLYPQKISDFNTIEASILSSKKPIPVSVIIPLGWILAAFAGTYFGALINKGNRRIIFFAIAIFTLMAAVMNMMLNPSPWYYWLLAAFIFPGALLGRKLVSTTTKA
ncbi:MAG: hypothetical protein GC181_01530 [Bacteroidetes bacterium]|nr:hypothetical protein [Bacteroidota bacterium]